MALIGVATIMLGGCSETGQFGNTFGSPISSNSSRVDRTPTGSVAAAPTSQVSDFFKEAFRPFGDQPAEPAPRPAHASRHVAPLADRVVPPAPISSAPLAPPVAATYAATYAAPVAAPSAPRPGYAMQPSPSGVGGWSVDGGTPIVVAQGESAEMIAQRYGVPTATLLSLNGYASRGQVQPGARMTIPVYHAGGARAAAAAPFNPPAAIKAPPAPRLAAKSLVGEEVAQARAVAPARAPQTLSAPKPDATALLADKRARLAQAKADQAKLAHDQAKLAQEKAALAQTDAAKRAEAHGTRQAAAEAAKKAADAKLAETKAVKAAQVAEAKVAEAKAAAAVQPKTAAVQAVAAPVKAETTKVARAEAPAAADATASLQPATIATADSANPEFRWPARGRVIQGYGNGGNDGINIAVPEGTQVKAAENGVVAYAGSELKGYGNLVLIRHPNGFVTAYANNGSLNVKRGDTVKRGQTIALSGQSGNVSSPQLHFELRKGSKPVDPSSYLAGL